MRSTFQVLITCGCRGLSIFPGPAYVDFGNADCSPDPDFGGTVLENGANLLSGQTRYLIPAYCCSF